MIYRRFDGYQRVALKAEAKDVQLPETVFPFAVIITAEADEVRYAVNAEATSESTPIAADMQEDLIAITNWERLSLWGQDAVAHVAIYTLEERESHGEEVL